MKLQKEVYTTLFSSLLPSYPDLLPIIQEIREKYNIPEVGSEDGGMTEVLLADEQIDWDAVRQDIEDQLRANPDILRRSMAGEGETKRIPKSFETSEF
ncbi:MAG: hypothetical protein A2X25_06715 [Chloroflexi bacterium GWB2_49_20]|nr:MAG: hypothetical protein A2X25_06715 [Chloroflexi bacterium GWB2_49_20]OGN80270.1 MAG: hypothetical protein A2X26_08065 [Chloroflexi bacterium GWC2_49_37]OGN86090.1 MAG: hypothetical protein A2X27_00680 [Chloroflexi bacterium GWD2_49_16]HCC79395.1 hypothetical protein [Anaerolineae bacterium]HCM96384.1 hypothetical protein [Anaerolineae bacterium]